jgi:hypothetical protein
MATRIPTTALTNTQDLEAVVNGPDDANRLFVFAGSAPVNVATGAELVRDSYTFLVGPSMSRRQFIRGVAHASISKWSVEGVAGNGEPVFAVELAEADWDDESQHVEVRVEVSVKGFAGAVSRIDYHVTVLAQM